MEIMEYLDLIQAKRNRENSDNKEREVSESREQKRYADALR